MYLYLWGFKRDGTLAVTGPYDSKNDKEYWHDVTIFRRGGVTPREKELSTRDQGVATQIIKHEAMGKTNNLETGLARAAHRGGMERPSAGASRRAPAGPVASPEVRYVED